MKRKFYDSLEIRLYMLEDEDIVTASAGEYDSAKDDDVLGDDIFG